MKKAHILWGVVVVLGFFHTVNVVYAQPSLLDSLSGQSVGDVNPLPVNQVIQGTRPCTMLNPPASGHTFITEAMIDTVIRHCQESQADAINKCLALGGTPTPSPEAPAPHMNEYYLCCQWSVGCTFLDRLGKTQQYGDTATQPLVQGYKFGH